MNASTKLRQLLARPTMLRTFAAHDVFTARIMEATGVETLFLGGFGASASLLGMPDLGLMTLSEMVDASRRMAGRLSIPLIADADTGHGGPQNVARSVREFEAAGVAGILLEDQVFPKRCGHFSGKGVISQSEMVEKLKLALETRQESDFVIIARTDARAVEGYEAAVERANCYGETGADLCFIEAPQTREELEHLPQDVPYPQLANMLVGGNTPIVSYDELETMGYKIAVDPISSLAVSGESIRKLVQTMQKKGRVDQLADQMLSFDEMKQLLGVNEFLQNAERIHSER